MTARTSTTGSASPTTNPWKVRIGDDDPEVHDIARLAVDGRPIALRSRHSAAAARDAWTAERDLGIVMLDVVRESDHAVRAVAEPRMAEAEQRLAGLLGESPRHRTLAVLREKFRRHRAAAS